jgi:malic enzyme
LFNFLSPVNGRFSERGDCADTGSADWCYRRSQRDDLPNTHRSRLHDDLQGTGGVRLAGLINTLKITGGQLKEQRVLFVGAEPAAIGLADLTVAGMGEQSVTPEAARQRIRMFDTQGLGSRGVPALPRTSCPTRASYPQQTL